MAKKILGLDLGTNSIGWALIEHDFDSKTGKIFDMGTRVIPMTQDILGEFGKGNSISQTAERTRLRISRRLKERHLLRRERLHRTLNILDFLPKHYSNQIDFQNKPGKFFKDTEPKLAYDGTDFIFKQSFEEMLEDFKKYQPGLLNRKNKHGQNSKIPYDWTIYYLRKKALNDKISKEELAWLLLNFNQKRGYYQLRGEESEEIPNKSVEFKSLRVIDVTVEESQKGRTDKWYSLKLENGWVYRRSSKFPLFDWNDKIKDFIVTTDLNDDGSEKTDKEGNVKRSFRAPDENDWMLVKKKTETEIELSRKTVGEYIYDKLLQKPDQKIRGKLVRTIERKFYKEELQRIMATQIKLQPELFTIQKYNQCVRELYRNNQRHQLILDSKDFQHLFINDIIFYQRPLRSQKSSISNCPFEHRRYKDPEGKLKIEPLKVIPKSNPYFQEFRLWQWILNLSICRKEDDKGITSEFLNSVEDWEGLFEFLNTRKEIDQKALLKYLLNNKGFKGKALNHEVEKYRWNYVEDKTYPCNETKVLLSSRLERVNNISKDFLSRDHEQHLWHIIYSVTDKSEYEKALGSYARKYKLDEDSFVEAFKKIPPLKSEYGSFSEKAIKKLLPLMRIGKYWDWNEIDGQTRSRISKILDGEFDENIKERVRHKAIHLQKEDHFQGLQTWLAQYVVYDRHSEASNASKWNSVEDLKEFLKEFKQHSLRNPIVEQVVNEALRVVVDIWQYYGKGSLDFFDEIHIELGRDLKKTADERSRLSKVMADNENTNLRIKALLIELANDNKIDNVRSHSPMQHELLKIYEEGVLNSEIEIDEDILKISKMAQPNSTELKRYKLWLEQKYRSPYTGDIIPLTKLFTPEYEIEHIIPQSRYFDDSLSNKVICESAINRLKDHQLGFEFIKNHHGELVSTGFGKDVKVFSEDEYIDFVKRHYSKNRKKRSNLLLEDIPEEMIERQLNDTRYISKFISSILSNIVRDVDNDDGVNSKNLIPCSGMITNQLKQDWGLNDIWNEIILPRFERMNRLTQSSSFTSWNEKYQKFIPTVPFELSKGFSKKRIDHRHHALDALVIACATRDHVNLLNNKYAGSKVRYDLNRKLRKFERVIYNHPKTGERIERDVPKEFVKPWENLTVDVRTCLDSIITTFKQNLRVINKATNYNYRWTERNGVMVKELFKQKGTNWAIRKSMHKDTVSGQVTLQRIKVPKSKILTATRKSLNASFNKSAIESITDTGIQKILLKYLESKGNNSELAFSPEGIEDLNRNIQIYNDGKPHKPINKVRVYEVGSKFPLGQTGNKKFKFVEADKGTNLFFAVYSNNEGLRAYETIPLNIVIERQKLGLSPVPDTNQKSDRLLFYLSPNDLVYVPNEEDNADRNTSDPKCKSDINPNRIYKMVSSTGNQCYFVHVNLASVIKSYDPKSSIGEMGSLNKLETTLYDTIRIKERCFKLKVDRLGNILGT
jgi:CRISPR-associated endonuclease Csn1